MFKSLTYSGPSLQTLHNEFAKNGRIDTAAAVQSSCHIDIQAPAVTVWELLSDASQWPLWYPGVKKVRLQSKVAVDMPFTWQNGAARIKSTFAVVEPHKELTWTGVSAGAKAIDRHILQQIPSGTRVTAEESMSGLLLGLFFNSKKLQDAQQAFLQSLKKAAEAA